MTGNELIKAAEKLWGKKDAKKLLASNLGLSRTQIWRLSKMKNVSGPVAAAMNCWLSKQ